MQIFMEKTKSKFVQTFFWSLETHVHFSTLKKDRNGEGKIRVYCIM